MPPYELFIMFITVLHWTTESEPNNKTKISWLLAEDGYPSLFNNTYVAHPHIHICVKQLCSPWNILHNILPKAKEVPFIGA